MKRMLSFAIPLVLAACTTPMPEAAQAADAFDAQSLGAQHWRLDDATTAGGQRIDALFVRKTLPIQLDFADGHVGIANACNRMRGSYVVTGGMLVVDRIASTMMACADPHLMALDREIGKRLEGRLTPAMPDSATLVLTTSGGDVLTFRGEPTPEARYGGPGERLFLEVAARTLPCPHPLIPDKQCLQVRELKYDDKGLTSGTPGAFENFYDGIEGYTHQAGVRNVLRIDRYTREHVPADASKYVYVLDMVVESEVVAP